MSCHLNLTYVWRGFTIHTILSWQAICNNSWNTVLIDVNQKCDMFNSVKLQIWFLLDLNSLKLCGLNLRQWIFSRFILSLLCFNSKLGTFIIISSSYHIYVIQNDKLCTTVKEINASHTDADLKSTTSKINIMRIILTIQKKEIIDTEMKRKLDMTAKYITIYLDIITNSPFLYKRGLKKVLVKWELGIFNPNLCLPSICEWQILKLQLKQGTKQSNI